MSTNVPNTLFDLFNVIKWFFFFSTIKPPVYNANCYPIKSNTTRIVGTLCVDSEIIMNRRQRIRASRATWTSIIIRAIKANLVISRGEKKNAKNHFSYDSHRFRSK